MMVKSISQSHHGQYKFKKKKVWINLNQDKKENIEYEVEIIDLSEYSIFLYDKKGKLILNTKNKSYINICV